MAYRILIYSDGNGPGARLSTQLAASGFAVELVVDQRGADRALRQDPRPVVILPSSSLDAGGHCAMFRSATSGPIVVILPEATDEHFGRDRTVAAWLEAGADAVISSAIGRRELAARLRAALRSQAGRETPTMAPVPTRIGELELDDAGYLVAPTGEAVSLTPTEFRLLAALARRQGRTVRCNDLLAEVWGNTTDSDARTLRLYVGYLRRKLEAVASDGPTVLNQRGVGYRLTAEAGLVEARAS